jgi:hypothetical protein
LFKEVIFIPYLNQFINTIFPPQGEDFPIGDGCLPTSATTRNVTLFFHLIETPFQINPQAAHEVRNLPGFGHLTLVTSFTAKDLPEPSGPKTPIQSGR